VFLVEFALMRGVAAVTWPPFAFLALSAAMLGGGVAGTLLVVRPSWVHRRGLAATGSVVAALGAPVAMLTVLHAGLEPLRVGVDVGATVVFVLALLSLSLPFVGLALTLSALLVAHPASTHRLYGADLTGAALGAFVSVGLLDAVGTMNTSLVAGAIGALSAWALASGPRARIGIAVGVVVSAIFVVPLGARSPTPTADKRIGPLPAGDVLRRLQQEGDLHTVDGADGRVDVIPAQPAPSVLIDLGAAVTRAPLPPQGDARAPRDAASAAFLARDADDGDVLVIGAGAGYEVARALLHGARHVDAVEVSRSVLTAATDGSIPASKALYDDARVTLHFEEARSFLEQRSRARTTPRWRHIVAVHTISNAAVTANAMRLAEDFLLTREALATLLRHVDDDGVLYMTRPRNQLALLVDLARAALQETRAGDVDAHIAVLEHDVDDPFFAGLLVAHRTLDRTQLAAPAGYHWASPPPPTGRPLPTDERPFFHRLADDVDAHREARLRVEGHDLAESAVAAVGALSVALAVLVLVAPLLVSAVARRRRGTDAPHATPHALPRPAYAVVSAFLGVGFMLFELSLAQRLTLVCGRPAVAFAAVVGGLLLGAGLAGLLRSSSHRASSLVAVLALAAVAIAASVAAPAVLDAAGALTWSPGARALVVAFVAATTGAPLGLCFPGVVAASERSAPGGAPWLYGVNTTTSVGATALHALLAPAIGLAGTTLLAATCYAAGAIVSARRRRR
jgi:hypothetical protein